MQITYNKITKMFEIKSNNKTVDLLTHKQMNSKAYALSVQILNDSDMLNSIYLALQENISNISKTTK